MNEKREEMTPERIEEIENAIMQTLFDLYEDQTGQKYTFELDHKEPMEHTA